MFRLSIVFVLLFSGCSTAVVPKPATVPARHVIEAGDIIELLQGSTLRLGDDSTLELLDPPQYQYQEERTGLRVQTL